MFKLKNPAGNVYKLAATEHRRQALLAQGYVPADGGKAPSGYDRMTLAQLTAAARQKGVDLGGAHRKADIIRIIEEAETAAPPEE